MSYTDEVGKKLNTLLKKTNDAEKLFEKAAEHAKNPSLKAFFAQKAVERNGFAQKLKNEILNFSHELETEGSAGGKLQRGWMDIKAFFSTNNDKSMLEEAISGEKAAIEEYKDVLMETPLPSSTEVMLTQQMNLISTNLSKIRSMEEFA